MAKLQRVGLSCQQVLLVGRDIRDKIAICAIATSAIGGGEATRASYSPTDASHSLLARVQRAESECDVSTVPAWRSYTGAVMIVS